MGVRQHRMCHNVVPAVYSQASQYSTRDPCLQERKEAFLVFTLNSLPTVDNLCKQFGPRSGPMLCWA